MKIVILDGYALNPGDLSWDAFYSLGDVTVYDRTPQSMTIERSLGADIIVTNKTPLDSGFFDAVPTVKYVALLSTGYNIVDIDAARRHNVPVSNVPEYCIVEVAQHIFALILEITNSTGRHCREVREGKWENSKDFCFWESPLMSLCGKNVGLIGFGKIGQAVAKVASAFRMNVFVSSRTDRSAEFPDTLWMPQDELFAASDIIVMCCPLTNETAGMINRDTISLMKKSAIFINTARGQVVDDTALADALNNGRIMAAGLDVLTVEPPAEGNPLIAAKNCFITPHIAWASEEARQRLMDISVDNVKAFLSGAPVNVVN